jgi:ribosomal 50S subunit-recycling heat shock protein
MGDDALRVDLLLHRLCITRSRSEAKAACDAGLIEIDGRPARASQEVRFGQQVTVRFATRMLEFELLQLPGRSTSRKAARELYRVLRDEPAARPPAP